MRKNSRNNIVFPFSFRKGTPFAHPSTWPTTSMSMGVALPRALPRKTLDWNLININEVPWFTVCDSVLLILLLLRRLHRHLCQPWESIILAEFCLSLAPAHTSIISHMVCFVWNMCRSGPTWASHSQAKKNHCSFWTHVYHFLEGLPNWIFETFLPHMCPKKSKKKPSLECKGPLDANPWSDLQDMKFGPKYPFDKSQRSKVVVCNIFPKYRMDKNQGLELNNRFDIYLCYQIGSG